MILILYLNGTNYMWKLFFQNLYSKKKWMKIDVSFEKKKKRFPVGRVEKFILTSIYKRPAERMVRRMLPPTLLREDFRSQLPWSTISLSHIIRIAFLLPVALEFCLSLS